LLLAVLALMTMVFLSDSRRSAAEAETENRRNQEAILRLLNEMGDLADGDLTVKAQVTEDITGAIADSMNYTIDELRNLVTGVTNAAVQVTQKTAHAQSISTELLDAAERQSKEIEDTTKQVLQVSKSISEVSSTAEEGARVAQRSLAASDKGRLAVQNSISGMNDIREQIQETSKRIKRLGESSQEIGEIVELISDITEQTNVLALNAAIQAASAGEAGRGFSVVAEEVQRLAERSGEATKQIGAIVKTIQADTQDAVAAMEKSTMGVVEGAKLSDAAGQALTEIDQVTKNLAHLIQTISQATQTQANATTKVAQNMQDILEITRQTTRGTQQAAGSIRDLAAVAQELKSSVSGFKLALGGRRKARGARTPVDSWHARGSAERDGGNTDERFRPRSPFVGQDRDRPFAEPGAGEPRQARGERGGPRPGQVHPHAPAPGDRRARDGRPCRRHALQRGAGEARRFPRDRRCGRPSGRPSPGEEGDRRALDLPRHAARGRGRLPDAPAAGPTSSSTARAARAMPTRATSSSRISRRHCPRRSERARRSTTPCSRKRSRTSAPNTSRASCASSRAATRAKRCARCTRRSRRSSRCRAAPANARSGPRPAPSSTPSSSAASKSRRG
jgi:methyl-accepting chemotaxis protein